MIKNLNKNLLVLLFVFLSLIPNFSFAQEVKLDYSGLVQCDGVINPDEKGRQRICDFNALLNTVKYIINWLFIISIPIATVAFAYGGLLYLSGSQGKISTAKSIFTSVATGFIIMLIAWVAVVTVVNWFVEKNTNVDVFVNIPK